MMMTAAKEVEQHIIRLGAKSRAVGIHLILQLKTDRGRHQWVDQIEPARATRLPVRQPNR